MNGAATERYWSFPTRDFNAIFALGALVWAGYTVAILILTFMIDRFGDLDRSVWEEASRAGQWFVLFIGVYLATDALSAHISHGQTRRDFAIETALLTVAYSAAMGLLLTLNWVIERIFYRIIDLPQRLEGSHLFDSATDYPLIFLEQWLVLTLWMAGGFFIAVSYYRHGSEGLIAIIPALLLASVADLAIGTSWGPAGNLFDRLLDIDRPPILASILITVACAAAIAAMAWQLLRDVPLRKFGS